MSNVATYLYTLHLADNALIMGQRNSEWTGHGPVLEQDIAITNISLDFLGQARNFYQYAASLYNSFSEQEKSAVVKYTPVIWQAFNREMEEDDLAFLREEHQFLNLLLTELPKGDWAQTVLRQFFFSAFQFFQYGVLEKSSDQQLAAIAEKSIKEVSYHLRWSGEWVIRLADGTAESKSRMNMALSNLWPFTGELFQPADYEKEAVLQGTSVLPDSLKQEWMDRVQNVFTEAGLEIPKTSWFQQGGKAGRHTEYMGFLLAEMQFLQRAYPNSVW
jgi:ring-1,2-phenylacetyl-CoA epoxidase subunit PaaC